MQFNSQVVKPVILDKYKYVYVESMHETIFFITLDNSIKFFNHIFFSSSSNILKLTR